MEKTKNTLQTKKVYEIDKPLQMVKMANLLKDHIVKNNLYANIAGKNYVMVEGWQFAGGLMGLFPRIVKVESLGTNKWMAQAEIVAVKTKEVMASGYAICSKEESKKKTFDEYAILSMAQTRAIGKAYRNLIGWVIKMTGYESTPAEEMKKGNEPIEGVKKDQVKNIMAVEPEKEKIKKLAKEMGIDTVKQIEKETEITIDWKNLTKVQASRIYAELLNHQVK